MSTGVIVLIVCGVIFSILAIVAIALAADKNDVEAIICKEQPMFTSKEIKVTTQFPPGATPKYENLKKYLDKEDVKLRARQDIPSSTGNVEVKTKTQVKKSPKVKKEKISKIDFILAVLKISGPRTSEQLAKEILRTYPGKSLLQNKNYTSVMLCHLKNKGKIERQMDGTYVLKVAKAKKRISKKSKRR